MFELALNHINSVHLLPEIKTSLTEMLIHEQQRAVSLPRWQLLPRLQTILGDHSNILQPFVEAWSMMCLTASHLDHLQDGDQDDLLEQWGYSSPLLYTILIGGLYGSQSMLFLLHGIIHPQRMLRLHQAWNTVMMRMVGGQYRDLLAVQVSNPLVHYQQLANEKSGSTFALAFGGMAMLLTDDESLINTMTSLGELYGTLLQYHDDMSDIEIDITNQLTFPQSLLNSFVDLSSNHTPQAFLDYVSRKYIDHSVEYINSLPIDMQKSMIELFNEFL